MNALRYALLNPSGNRTALVLDPVPAAGRNRITAALIDRCEQVGYLMPPSVPGVLGRLQMMGGEFCGNASMAAAAFLLRSELKVSETRDVLLEVSGAEKPVFCRICREKDGWLGTVEMPLIQEILEVSVDGEALTAVRLPGILHLIDLRSGRTRAASEALLRKAAEIFPDPALGLLQWREAEGKMIPLVFVRESGTLVWESACGSGSTALAGWIALQSGQSMEQSISQPGGVLRVRAELREGQLHRLLLTGRVVLEETGVLSGPEAAGARK